MAKRATPAPKRPRTPQPTTPKKGPGQWSAAFLRALAKTGNVSDAARRAKVNRKTAYNHRESDPAFAAAWDDACEDACDALELEARRRAVEGVDRGEHGRHYSDTLLIFLLKAHRPAKFRDSVRVSGDPAAPVKVEVSGHVEHAVAADALRAFAEDLAAAGLADLPGDGRGEPVGPAPPAP